MHCSHYATYLGIVLNLSRCPTNSQIVGHTLMKCRKYSENVCEHGKSHYYKVLAPILLKDLHNHLVWCIKQSSAQLAQSSCNCLENIILSNQVKSNASEKDINNYFHSPSLVMTNGKVLLSVSDE